jgi:hypothetical protein
MEGRFRQGRGVYTRTETKFILLIVVLTVVGIEDGVAQLSKFEIDDLERGIVTAKDIRKEVTDFRSTYRSIMNLVRQKQTNDPKRNTTISSSQATNIISSPQRLTNPSANARKRPVPPTSSQGPIRRTKSTTQASSAGPKTPDQPTVLPSPGNSGGTDKTDGTDKSGTTIKSDGTGKSGDTTESTDEDLTRTFINTVLDDAGSCLDSDFLTLTWSKSQVKTQFEHGYPLQIRR